MMYYNDMRKKRVSQSTPVQAYLGPEERERLERLARQLETSKSEILRRGIEALERQLTDPAAHPALRVIGLAREARRKGPPADVAREHDRFLGDSEEAGWTKTRRERARER